MRADPRYPRLGIAAVLRWSPRACAAVLMRSSRPTNSREHEPNSMPRGGRAFMGSFARVSFSSREVRLPPLDPVAVGCNQPKSSYTPAPMLACYPISGLLLPSCYPARFARVRGGARQCAVVRDESPARATFLRDRALACARANAIGAPGFEPGTSPTRTVRATRLRHAPRRKPVFHTPPAPQGRISSPPWLQ